MKVNGWKARLIMFTEDDLDNCWEYQKTYLLEILNGEYELTDAREDLKGLIGSQYDDRIPKQTQTKAG